MDAGVQEATVVSEARGDGGFNQRLTGDMEGTEWT